MLGPEKILSPETKVYVLFPGLNVFRGPAQKNLSAARTSSIISIQSLEGVDFTSVIETNHNDLKVTLTMSQQLLLFDLTLSASKVDSFSIITTSSHQSCRSIIGWKVILML